MSFVLRSPAKVNLTLRVVGNRSDGFHELRSLFLAIPAVETLTITPLFGPAIRDHIVVSGEPVEGRNILEDVLDTVRRKSPVPSLMIHLHKVLPPGSGMGGGSGNAAALIRWLDEMTGNREIAGEEIGSDIPFLLHGARTALVRGRGEHITPLPPFRRGYSVLAVIPAWGSSTREAFAQYDRQSGTHSMNAHQAEEELLAIYSDLMQGEKKVGLLPNDFLPLLCTNHPEYLRLFSLFDEGGATAWGLTGSGSGAFALFPDPGGFSSVAKQIEKNTWVRKILFLE